MGFLSSQKSRILVEPALKQEQDPLKSLFSFHLVTRQLFTFIRSLGQQHESTSINQCTMLLSSNLLSLLLLDPETKAHNMYLPSFIVALSRKKPCQEGLLETKRMYCFEVSQKAFQKLTITLLKTPKPIFYIAFSFQELRGGINFTIFLFKHPKGMLEMRFFALITFLSVVISIQSSRQSIKNTFCSNKAFLGYISYIFSMKLQNPCQGTTSSGLSKQRYLAEICDRSAPQIFAWIYNRRVMQSLPYRLSQILAISMLCFVAYYMETSLIDSYANNCIFYKILLYISQALFFVQVLSSLFSPTIICWLLQSLEEYLMFILSISSRMGLFSYG